MLLFVFRVRRSGDGPHQDFHLLIMCVRRLGFSSKWHADIHSHRPPPGEQTTNDVVEDLGDQQQKFYAFDLKGMP